MQFKVKSKRHTRRVRKIQLSNGKFNLIAALFTLTLRPAKRALERAQFYELIAQSFIALGQQFETAIKFFIQCREFADIFSNLQMKSSSERH